jgi:hypothetical protein
MLGAESVPATVVMISSLGYSPDAIFVGEVEVPARVHSHVIRSCELRVERCTAVSGITSCTVAGNRKDETRGGYHPDSGIGPVGDVEVPSGVDGEALR